MKTQPTFPTKIALRVANIAGWVLISALAVVVVGLITLNSIIVPRARVPPAPRRAESRAIATMRRAGIAEDHSQIPTLRAVLNNPAHSDSRYTALHALAQIGAEEALPDIDPLIQMTIMQTDMDPDLSNFARAARARLLAESTTKDMPQGQARAQSKMEKLLDEAGVSVGEMNAAPMYRNAEVRSISLYTLRELADMIYQKHDVTLAQYAQAQGVDFGSQSVPLLITAPGMIPSRDDDSQLRVDIATAVKVKLAPLSDQQRLTWLIDNLAQTFVMDGDTRFVIQLAIDQGLPSSHAAAAKLKDMQAHPNEYRNECGYGAMFDIIAGVGDKQQLPLLEQFVNAPGTDDLSRDNRHYANIALMRFQEGTTPTFANGY